MKRELKSIPGNPFLCKKGFPGPFPKNSNITWLAHRMTSGKDRENANDAVPVGHRILRDTGNLVCGRLRMSVAGQLYRNHLGVF